MSSRFFQVAGSALLLASLCGVAAPVSAADTKPLVPETCVAIKRATPVGHPGKSIQLPRRTEEVRIECSGPARKRLVLTSYTDNTGGRALLSGRSEHAVELLHAKRALKSSPRLLTNLCVAHTVLRQWTEARDACDTAVASAIAKRAELHNRPNVSRTQLDTDASVAYSNRAVMHWLSRDTVAAQNDLASARAISPRASYVLRNARITVDAPSLAQATAEVDDIG